MLSLSRSRPKFELGGCCDADPGKNFTSFQWHRFVAYSSKPIIISEYGIDAFDSDAPTGFNLLRNVSDIDAEGPNLEFGPAGAGPGQFIVGAPNEPMQAEWLLTLIEDLERHSTTCVGPQCKEPVASGGSLMAWVDELWKGRVEEAMLGEDPRVSAMESVRMCPDRSQFYHALCGYPSGAQPDQFVNEEWSARLGSAF